MCITRILKLNSVAIGREEEFSSDIKRTNRKDLAKQK